jgi:nucleoside-diphosphate-sugar epimerase
MKTILMTGATGFLGSNLLRRILAGEQRVIILTRRNSNFSRIDDLLPKVRVCRADKVNFETLFQEEKIDAVLHCATNYGRKVESPYSILEANLMLPLKLLQIGADNGLKCFINTDTILDKRVSYYSLSKAQFRDWLKLYSDRLICGNVALEHFFGPGDDETKFVTLMVRSLLRRSPKIPLTLGEQKRDFIYIDDVVEAFSSILRRLPGKRKGFYPFEIGRGSTISVKDFMLLLKKLTENRSTKLDFGAIPYRENEVMESKVNLAEIRALGWSPTVSLLTGLKRTIKSEKGRLDK